MEVPEEAPEEELWRLQAMEEMEAFQEEAVVVAVVVSPEGEEVPEEMELL